MAYMTYRRSPCRVRWLLEPVVGQPCRRAWGTRITAIVGTHSCRANVTGHITQIASGLEYLG